MPFFLFPVVVEDGDRRSTAILNGIGGTGDGAIIIASLRGDGFHGGGLTHNERSSIWGTACGWVGAVSGIEDVCTFGCASDAHVLFFSIGACFRCEGRCGHSRHRWLNAFGLYEEVEVEVVAAIGEVVGMVRAEVMVAV